MSLPRLSKKESRKISKWLDAHPLPPMRWGARRKTSDQRGVYASHFGRERQPYQRISIKNILLPKSDEKLDESLVAQIAESIELFDLLHPIVVRPATKTEAGKAPGDQFVLVAGAHRLEAMRRLKRTRVWCGFLDGNEIDAELVRLGEDLWRKTLSVLRRAEKTVLYYNLASAKVNISGQVVRKSKVGRKPGGVSLAARELPLIGRTEGARRKLIERALSISGIEPKAKKAAIEAHLDNNQRALLQIAEAGGPKAQRRKVIELAEKLNAPMSHIATQPAKGNKGSKGTTIQSPPLQPDAAGSVNTAGAAENENAGQPSRKTTLDEMWALWKPKCHEGWAYVDAYDREQFIEKIRRARRRVHADVVEFLSDAFRGRHRLGKQDLFSLAAQRGFTRKAIRNALKWLGHKSARKGKGWDSKSFFVNPDRHWMQQSKVISDREIELAVDAQPNPRDTRSIYGRKRRTADDLKYLDDVG